MRDPGSISVNPASLTTGRPVPASAAHPAGSAVRTETARSLSRHARRARVVAPHQASWAACPAWAMALPADIASSGLSQSTTSPGGPGSAESTSSVPET